MSDSQRLPDDLSAWPKDPYAILGVRQGVSRNELRRAYATLLKRFNPEHFPAQFRRLRDAYEFLLTHVERNQPAVLPEDEIVANPFIFENGPQDAPEPISGTKSPAAPATSAAADGAAADDNAADDNADDSEMNPRPQRPWSPLKFSDLDEWETLWQQALAGEQSAYDRLKTLETQCPGRREICARLYWLLLAWPEFDPARDPCDWLARGLAASRLTGPLAELYRRELKNNPAEAETERSANLLESAATPGALADFLNWRFLALGKLGRFQRIAEELESQRDWLSTRAEALWAQLLLSGIDQLAWSSDPESDAQTEAFWKEFDDLPHLHTQLSAALDRTEFLRQVAKGWRALQGTRFLLQELLNLVRDSTLDLFENFTTRTLAVLQKLIAKPGLLLQMLDRIDRQSRPVLSQINRLVLECQDRQYDAKFSNDLHIYALAQLPQRLT